jgi:sphingolipid C9-methyltransferase
MSSSPVITTDTPAIKNAPLISLAEGNGYFSNVQLVFLIIVVPWLVKRVLPIVNYGGLWTYVFLLVLLGVPITILYWTLMSMYGKRKNEKVAFPGKNIEEYITIHDKELKMHYNNKQKIPMQVFHDAYFDKKIDFNGVYVL